MKTSSDIPIGSVVIFKSSSYRYAHVAVYAGYYNGKHFITHCGGDEGPCIQAIDSLYLYAGQSVKLIVAPNLYNDVKLNKSSLTLGKGESYTIKAMVMQLGHRVIKIFLQLAMERLQLRIQAQL